MKLTNVILTGILLASTTAYSQKSPKSNPKQATTKKDTVCYLKSDLAKDSLKYQRNLRRKNMCGDCGKG